MLKKIVLITGLLQNISETPNLVKMKEAIFGLYIKMPCAFILLCIYYVNIIFFSLLVFGYWKVNFSVVNFLTMVFLVAVHFVKHQEMFSV